MVRVKRVGALVYQHITREDLRAIVSGSKWGNVPIWR
jgi:hypothetical protein